MQQTILKNQQNRLAPYIANLQLRFNSKAWQNKQCSHLRNDYGIHKLISWTLGHHLVYTGILPEVFWVRRRKRRGEGKGKEKTNEDEIYPFVFIFLCAFCHDSYCFSSSFMTIWRFTNQCVKQPQRKSEGLFPFSSKEFRSSLTQMWIAGCGDGQEWNALMAKIQGLSRPFLLWAYNPLTVQHNTLRWPWALELCEYSDVVFSKLSLPEVFTSLIWGWLEAE